MVFLNIDCVSLIIPFMNKPAILRCVCSCWRNKFDFIVKKRANRLLSLYDTPKKALDREYSTVYTAMRNALRSKLTSEACICILTICTCSGYLPIPWDLLAYDVSTYKRSIPKRIIQAISYRWSHIGKLIYMILSENNEGIENITINQLKEVYNLDIPKIKLKNELYWLVKGSSEYQYERWVADVYEVYAGLPFLDTTPPFDHGIQPLLDEIALATDPNWDCKYNVEFYIESYINNQGWNHKKDIKEFATLEREYSRHEIDPRIFPFSPWHLDIKNAVILDRPDIIDILYDDPKKVIEDIYRADPNSPPIPLGPRVKEYLFWLE